MSTKQWVKEHFGDQLVDEELDFKFKVRHYSIGKYISWIHDDTGHYRLARCGYVLNVCRHGSAGWYVTRNGEALVHSRSPREALFRTSYAAKMAGYVHLYDEISSAEPVDDGLRWKAEPADDGLWRKTQSILFPPGFPYCVLTSDDQEGRRRLDHLLKQSGAAASAADDNLIIDLEWGAKRLQLQMPTWAEREKDCFELVTGHGTLTIRRLIGWTVERNGAPLVWFMSGRRVVFNKLVHAKMSALLHASDKGYLQFLDGTRWEVPADKQLTEKVETPGYQPAAGGSDVLAA